MNYENTELYFLEKDVKRNFGDELGQKIFNRSAKLNAELSVTTDYKKSPTFERQLTRLVFPVMAYYKTLLAFGYRKDAALGLVRTEVERAAQESGEVLANQMRPIFPFRAFKGNIKNFIEYKFPSCVWKTANLNVKGSCIRFEVQECFYCTMTEKFGCPELGEIFCEYEKSAFDGMLPQVRCERGGMIATGHDVCEYCFRKGERKKK